MIINIHCWQFIYFLHLFDCKTDQSKNINGHICQWENKWIKQGKGLSDLHNLECLRFVECWEVCTYCCVWYLKKMQRSKDKRNEHLCVLNLAKLIKNINKIIFWTADHINQILRSQFIYKKKEHLYRYGNWT